MCCGGMVGGVKSAGGKIGFKLITLSREPLAVSMFLPTSYAYVFCAMTPSMGARR